MLWFHLQHGKKVNQKLYGYWANMCSYTNRNFGFNQRVITRITNSHFLSSAHYAGLVWQNDKSLQELDAIWYTVIKSAVGAVFHIRRSVAEKLCIRLLNEP